MILLSYNCRGLGNPKIVFALCEIIKSRHLDILFLYETLIHAKKIKELWVKFSFDVRFCADCLGIRGDLTLL